MAGQIENYTEAVEYMDGVSSVDSEDDDAKSRLSQVSEVMIDERMDGLKAANDCALLSPFRPIN